MTKILYIDQTGQLGGGELAILPWLRAHSDGARMVLLEDGPFRALVEECGIPVDVYALDSLKGVRRESGVASLFYSLPAIASLRRRLADLAGDFDILYANSQKAFLLAALSKRRAQPLIWHLRDLLTAEHFSPTLRKIAVFAGNRYASAIIANSHATAESFVAAGGLRSKVRVVHDGVSPLPFDNVATETIAAVRKEMGCDERPTIGIFGRLSPWKGQHIVLDALSTLREPQVALVGDALFGEQAYVDRLKERANQPDIAGRVQFLGFRRDIPELMKSMDIIVHSSTSAEPFGLVIVEGMLARKPVIATQAGGAVEIIQDGESGLLVAPGSVSGMREAIEQLLADPEAAKHIADTGRRRAEDVFSLEALFEGISRVIADCKHSHIPTSPVLVPRVSASPLAATAGSPRQGTTAHYRRDIDGLRAVAVLLVVFNHLHTRATGGYIGVDVFFVISGYLISSHIMTEMAAGTFSLAEFYERRIRRILPALLVMLLAVTVLAYLYFVPSEIEAYALSLLAALFSISNMVFWHEAGYFDAPSALKPLLHTWSLGVEEQFYIFFPLFLFFLRRWLPTRIKAAIWTVTLASFGMACFWVRRDPTAAFFFAPLRAWELLVGTILSQGYLPSISRGFGRNLAATAGIVLILVPALVYSRLTVFPGVTALAPCLGAALLIAAGESGTSQIGRILSWGPIVFVGLISYSLYLWHWPILAFQDIVPFLTKTSDHSKGGKLGFMMVSLSIATLSWRFIETPFRKGSLRPGRRTLFLINGGTIFVLATIALIMLAAHGIPPDFPEEALQLNPYTHYSSDNLWRHNVCFFTPDTNFSDLNISTCLHEDNARRQFLLIGDSHAADLYPGLSKVFPELNISQANATFCPPLVTEPVLRPEFASNCDKLSQFIFGDYLLHHRVDTVLLSAFWEESQFAELGRTISWIRQHGMRVVVFGPSIEFAMPLPRILIASLRDHAPGRVEKYEKVEPRQLDITMARLARDQWKVPYVSVFETLCTSRTELGRKGQGNRASSCPVYAAPGVPLLFDTNHFTAEGAELYARAMRDRNLLSH